MTRPWILPMAVATLALAAVGCTEPPKTEDPLRADLAKANAQLSETRLENKRLLDQVATQDQRILSLLNLGPKRLDKVFHVKSISLGDYTGGVNTDNNEGDDAVKVFVLPMDQDGSILKAAGDVKIQLYDLAAPPDQTLVQECTFKADEISKSWSSGFLTYHYSFVCPWKSGKAPQHNEITVRVEFVDYMTAEHFSAQKTIKIKLPPTSQPGK